MAEESAQILEIVGVENVQRHYDIGVAGIHRLFNALPQFKTGMNSVLHENFDD